MPNKCPTIETFAILPLQQLRQMEQRLNPAHVCAPDPTTVADPPVVDTVDLAAPACDTTTAECSTLRVSESVGTSNIVPASTPSFATEKY